MNCLSINVQGFGSAGKRSWVYDLCRKHGVKFLSLQETKLLQMDFIMVKRIWGNSRFDFASSSARGRSGGIICVWDDGLFVKNRVFSDPNFLIVEGIWKPCNMVVVFVSVYAPQPLHEKIILWTRLKCYLDRWNGEVIMMGDFNEVREAHERYGSVFCQNSANAFNSFIRDSCLVDIPLDGYMFTWSTPSASKMSKLDRFLVSEGVSDIPGISALVLDRRLSDHRPILLREVVNDYGPTPFRFFYILVDGTGFPGYYSRVVV